MSPRFRLPIWLWLALAASTAVSLWVGAERYKAETANRAIHLMIDMPDVRLLAGSSGEPVSEILAELKSKGATAVAIAEETFDELVATGKIVIEGTQPVRYLIADQDVEDRIRTFATKRLTPPAEPVAEFVFADGSTLALGVPITDMRTFGVGFNKEDASAIQNAGLAVVARIVNQPLSSRSAIDALLDSAKQIQAQGILFGGDQVIGRRDLIVYAADQIRESGLWIGPVEFTSQGGLPRITKELKDSLIRVHSMVATEIDRNEPPDIVDRYVRSVVERSMKALFLRPISLSSEDPLEEFGTFIATIRDRLAREGYQAKPARPAVPEERPLWAAMVIGLGIVCEGGFLTMRLAGTRWGIGIALFLAALTASIAIGFGLKYLALAGALVFPTLAMLAAFDRGNGPGNSGKWIAAFFWITLFSTIGGLHVAALLTTPDYMLRIDQYFGVKVAHFLPPVIIAVYLLYTENDAKSLLRGTVRWIDVLVMGAIMVAVYIMLNRTGNDNPGDVSALELKLRNFLDRVLPERPRTKEFMFGYPGLIVSLWMAFKGTRSWLPLTVFIAAIGQVSVLNTFCHLHTPIAVSMLRVIVGVVVGGVFGLIAMLVLQMASKKRSAA
jgi:hypothetical protein